ncbi:MAG: prepilin-type N-terminal cleavage/methylation domain-containing protein [Armatimonadetes bacterium]|nr:prepilin-type N-terminal cleavage/methylation domain-containing protein [Armatimonadota bacterium]MBX3109129.1 prepilin-type N-terminal cleavage/methylation domain-containing protein [Fimbriimonadaceae bacterium]
MKKAFTLIELLVVIAIIAILAAILFPVFAQAKVAAKKTQDLSNQKNMGTAIQIYLSDYDDLFPLAYPYISGQFQWLSYVDTPQDWDGSGNAAYFAAMGAAWPNNVRPYIKNDQILASPGSSQFSPFGNIYGTAVKPTSDVGYSFNTLLTQYSSTAVTDVAKLRVITNPYGNRNFKGLTRPGSRLNCRLPGPCQYVPSSPSCNGAARNGEWSELSNPNGASMWMFGQGMNATYADSHAKFTRVAGGPTTASDFRNDFWAAYNANGVARWNEWQDTNFCHTLLFMPDFDFQNFGTPVFF